MNRSKWPRALVVGALALMFAPSANAASFGTLKQYKAAAGSDPKQITRGSDGNMWFTGSDVQAPSPPTHTVSRITPDGAVTDFSVCDFCYPNDIVQGPDQILYFTKSDSALGRITTSGVVLPDVPTPNTDANGNPIVGVIGNYIAANGTDLWFTDFNNSMVWRYDTVTGAFTYFQTPTRPSNPHDVAVDASGIVWFTESNVGAIARLDPATGTITETPVSGSPRQLAISPIDGVVWFTDRFNHTVGRLDPTTNEVLVFALPAASGPEDIAVTPAGEVWFTQSVAGNAAQISADGVVIAEGKIVKSSEPFGIAIGHDGTSIWYAMLSADKIGVLMSK